MSRLNLGVEIRFLLVVTSWKLLVDDMKAWVQTHRLQWTGLQERRLSWAIQMIAIESINFFSPFQLYLILFNVSPLLLTTLSYDFREVILLKMKRLPKNQLCVSELASLKAKGFKMQWETERHFLFPKRSLCLCEAKHLQGLIGTHSHTKKP